MSQGFEPKKSLGQHWLNDQNSLLSICNSADLSAEDIVVEIGPGLGSLTKLLVSRVKQVIAVEIDERLASELSSSLQAENLQIIAQDIMKFDFTSIKTTYKIVANIPYYLSNNLIRVLSVMPNPPISAVLLVQKEVAQRAAAKPGNMSLLSVTAQYYWKVNLGEVIPAKLFEPPPKIDSQVLILNKRHEQLFPGLDTKEFFKLIKAGFAQRRKTLLNSLSAGLHLSRDQAEALCEDASIDSKRRAQTISLYEWYQLYSALHT